MTKKSDEWEFDISRLWKGHGKKAASHMPIRKRSRNPERYAWIILLIIPILLAAYFRLYPLWLPKADTWAHDGVVQNIRANIAGQLTAEFPTLPADRVNVEVDKRFAEVYEQNREQIEQTIAQNAAYLRSQFQNEEATGFVKTYIPDIDPYFQLVRVRNTVENGHPGEELRDGRPYQTLTLAPKGGYTNAELHNVLTAGVYSFVHGVSPKAQLYDVFYLMPVFLAAISIVPAFFIIRRKTGVVGAFIGTTLIGVFTTYLLRSTAGVSDTDSYAVFFGLLVTWMFLESAEAKTLVSRIVFAGLAGVFVGLFSFAWAGWWYIFDFLIVAGVAFILYDGLRIFIAKRNINEVVRADSFRKGVLSFVLFIVVSGIAVALFSGFSQFVNAPLQPLRFSLIKDAVHESLWPNVYTTVAELNPASVGNVIGSVGGKAFFLLGYLGVIATLLRGRLKIRDWILLGVSIIVTLYAMGGSGISGIWFILLLALPVVLGLLFMLRDPEIDAKYAIILTIWFAGTLYASFKGVRFILLFAPAFAVAFGVFVGFVHRQGTQWMSFKNSNARRIAAAALAVVLCLVLIQPLRAADVGAREQVPMMNDGWYQSLTGIRDRTDENSIITSWWDFGHWFRAIANRGVTFDGGSQNGPDAHWVGRALVTSDEDEAVGIIRMLDCSQNDGFEYLQELYPGMTEQNVKTLYGALKIHDGERVIAFYRERGLSADQAVHLAGLTHCAPPQGIFITSADMVSKSAVWGHFGLWDFERARVYSSVKRYPRAEAIQVIFDSLNVSRQEAERLYTEASALGSEEDANRWVADWPSYVNDQWRGCDAPTPNVTQVRCQLGMGIGRTPTGDADIVLMAFVFDYGNLSNASFDIGFVRPGTNQLLSQSSGQPAGIVIATNDSMNRTATPNQAFGLDAVYDEVTNRVFLAPPALSTSMFTRLFFMGGRTTEYFEPFSDVTAVSGQRIIVYEIRWPA